MWVLWRIHLFNFELTEIRRIAGEEKDLIELCQRQNKLAKRHDFDNAYFYTLSV
jgi:hypothetical protein